MNKKDFFLGLALGISVMTACATTSARYYGLSLPDDCYSRGTLLGDSNEWPDMSFDICRPSKDILGKCIIQKDSDFFGMKQSLANCVIELDACQRGPMPREVNSNL
jgi:hypothetical protein